MPCIGLFAFLVLSKRTCNLPGLGKREMGNFYINHTVCSPDIPAVVQVVESKDAFVSRPRNSCVVIFDKASEQSPSDAVKVGKTLSAAVNGTQVLTIMIHDDDIMLYWLHVTGEEVDSYNSNPSYMEMDDPPLPPIGGDSEKLCKAFGISGTAEVEAILRSHGDASSYVFQTERHNALATALRLPKEAVSAGYSYLEAGDYPSGFAVQDFTRFRP